MRTHSILDEVKFVDTTNHFRIIENPVELRSVTNSNTSSPWEDLKNLTKIAREQSKDQWFALVSAPVVFNKKAQKFIYHFLQENPECEMFYTDSSSLDSRKHKFLRTDFCLERLRSQMFLGPIVFIKKDILLKTIALMDRNSPANDYSLALYAATLTQVGHIPEIVYNQRFELNLSPAQQEEYSRIVSAYMEKFGGGVVDAVSAEGVVFSRRVVTGKPLVSIVIPTQARFSSSRSVHDAFVVKAVKSIINKTKYEHFEIDLIVDADFDAGVMTELASIAKKKLRVHFWDRPFNFSQKMNYGVVLSRGDFVLLLNDDVEVINDTWLENMLALAQLPNAGMVGAMLYYEDDTIQHAGHAYYQGSPTHIGLGLPRGTTGPNSSFLVERRVSGVTAACAVMPRHVFMDAGGFSALLPGNFNDVDLCLKVGSLGYDIYWTPNAELYHYESKTRDARVHFYELDVIEHRWAHRLDDKSFWSWNPRTKQI